MERMRVLRKTRDVRHKRQTDPFYLTSYIPLRISRSLRDLRHKIKAVTSTRQVTRAMELVAASKMRKAIVSAQMLRRYATVSWQILRRIAKAHTKAHPYLEERTPGRLLTILLTSDRGLCGNLNAQMLRAAQEEIIAAQKLASFTSMEFIAVGRKGQQFLHRLGHTVTAAFPALSSSPRFRDILPIVRMASQGYLDGKYDRVILLYPSFRSALTQEATVKVLLPLSEREVQNMMESVLGHKPSREETDIPLVKEYLFEPSEQEILETILPQLTELQVYQAVLESSASEHSARMIAMHSATNNADDLLDDLTLAYHQTRQERITSELSELSASKAALEG